MFLPNFISTIVTLSVIQEILCFIPQRQQIASLAPISSGNFPFRLQDAASDDNVRMAYDPGEESLKMEEAPYQEGGYNELSKELELTEKVALKDLENEIQQDQDIAAKSAILMKMLEDPSLQTLPLVYVEDEAPSTEGLEQLFGSPIQKRSRYYRRYPWKRQNSRHRTYEADTRYLCVPSREDVFKLLVGLHENRNGNHHKTVSFCNRKRPAKAIFTNIRFLG